MLQLTYTQHVHWCEGSHPFLIGTGLIWVKFRTLMWSSSPDWFLLPPWTLASTTKRPSPLATFTPSFLHTASQKASNYCQFTLSLGRISTLILRLRRRDRAQTASFPSRQPTRHHRLFMYSPYVQAFRHHRPPKLQSFRKPKEPCQVYHCTYG